MGDGFRVDLDAMRSAVTGVLTTMDEMATLRVQDAGPPTDALGHARLAEVTAQFCRRWEIGVTNLEKDVDAIIVGLADSLQGYLASDEAGSAGLSGVISRASGADPGVP